MARNKNKNASDMVQISISLPRELVKKIDEMAAADNRNRSNFISNVFRRIAEEKLGCNSTCLYGSKTR